MQLLSILFENGDDDDEEDTEDEEDAFLVFILSSWFVGLSVSSLFEWSMQSIKSNNEVIMSSTL